MTQPQPQYSLREILGIWALATVPMGLLAWVVMPDLMRYVPLHPGIFYWLLMISGMIWQCGLALWMIYQETGRLEWKTMCQPTWLNLPQDPNTNEKRWLLLLWIIPCILFSAVINLAAAEWLLMPLLRLFPWLSPPAYADVSQLATPEFVEKTWLFGLALIHGLFKYFLGEELLFRGVLLPRMAGVFGKGDWLANAIFFGFSHLHTPWALPGILLSSLAIAWPAKRFRSSIMAILVHGADGVFLLFAVLNIVVGRL